MPRLGRPPETVKTLLLLGPLRFFFFAVFFLVARALVLEFKREPLVRT